MNISDTMVTTKNTSNERNFKILTLHIGVFSLKNRSKVEFSKLDKIILKSYNFDAY